MRLWSISPKYLDSKGLVALWREALLAKAVLAGKTKGYRNHPQLERFRAAKNPVDSINKYLEFIYVESQSRGYNFDKSKFDRVELVEKLSVTDQQLRFEFDHLLQKLKFRDSSRFSQLRELADIESHSLFYVVTGVIEEWERR